jgi:hypothetical protein
MELAPGPFIQPSSVRDTETVGFQVLLQIRHVETLQVRGEVSGAIYVDALSFEDQAREAFTELHVHVLAKAALRKLRPARQLGEVGSNRGAGLLSVFMRQAAHMDGQ